MAQRNNVLIKQIIIVTQKEQRTPHPFRSNASLKEVLFADLISYITGVLYLFAVICLIALFLGVAWFGLNQPQESPAEIAIGYLLITGVVISVIRLRRSRIMNTLKKGKRVTAEVLEHYHYQEFLWILLKFSLGDKSVQKRLWFPNTKHTRTLLEQDELSLSIHTANNNRIIVRNLYSK